MHLWNLCTIVLFTSTALSQNVWKVAERDSDIQLDGFLKEWSEIPKMVLNPSTSGVGRIGTFDENSLDVTIQAVWDRENLYVAIHWHDDIWDVARVPRSEAVWLSADSRRRDRMLFYDNIRFQIRQADYDFMFWFSPRIEGKGPFNWHRLLEGLKGMEAAVSSPLLTTRSTGDEATVEIIFPWRELRIKPENNRVIPFTLLVADSDHPGLFLQRKEKLLKWLEWRPQLQLTR